MSAKSTLEHYASVVQVFVPPGAWAYLDQMHEFHVRNGIRERYWRQRTGAGDVLRWEFPEPAYAEFFIAEFGGELLPSLPTDDFLISFQLQPPVGATTFAPIVQRAKRQALLF